MMNLASLPAAEIDARVQAIGTPLAAPLAMPRQVLESVAPLSLRRVLRGVLSALHIGPAPRQEM